MQENEIKNIRDLINSKNNNLSVYENNKINFLKTNYDKISTMENYYRTFKNYILDEEKARGKDLYDFSIEETIDLINSIPTSSARIKKTLSSLIRMYNDWAISRGFNISGTNVMNSINNEEVEKINLRRLKSKYVTREMLEEWVAKAEMKGISPQFTIIPILAWFGICGTKCSEMTNLRIKDIDFEKKVINIYDYETFELKKIIEIDDYVANKIQQAIECQGYKVEVATMKLYDSEYLLKSTSAKTKLVGSGVIFGRYRKMMATVKYNTNVTLKDIYKSAKIRSLLEVHKEKGFLDIMDIRTINSYYDTTKIENSSYFNLKEDMLLIFGDEIEIRSTNPKANNIATKI